MNLTEIQDIDVRAVIKTGIILRHEAYNLEQEAKALKTKANELLAAYVISLEDMKVTHEGTGTAAIVITERSKFDKNEFKLQLAQAGVSAGIIASAEKASVTVSSSDSIRFTPWREEE